MRKNMLYYITSATVALCLVFWRSGCSGADHSVQWFVKITDDCREVFCQELLASTLRTLHGQTYVLTKQGKVVLSERNLKTKDEIFSPHQFFILDKCSCPDIGSGKIYLRFNPKNENGLYNADILLFLLHKNGSWERVLNPGNFTFRKESTQSELQERIKELIVGLTFK
jgi:hypothetical protein